MTSQPQPPDDLPSSIWGALKRIVEWGARIASLEKRVSALEDGLNEPFRCQMCGEKMSAFKTTGGANGPHGTLEFWACKKCGETDERWIRK